jgi:hypothetical protein
MRSGRFAERHSVRAATFVLAAAAGLRLGAHPCAAEGGEATANLHVTRAAGAEGCTDRAALDAAVSRLVGREAFTPGSGTPESAPLQVDVLFSPATVGYAARVRMNSAHGNGERLLADGSATCASLSEAVVIAIAITLDGAGAAPPAKAEEAAAPEPPPAPRRLTFDPDDVPPRGHPLARSPADDTRHWYGWQILASDTAALLSLVGARAGSTGPGVVVLAAGGFGAWYVGAPIIHGFHRNPGGVWGSLAMRVLFPLVGGVVGSVFRDCASANGRNGDSSLGAFVCRAGDGSPFLAGVVLGVLTTTAIDATALSWAKDSPPPRSDDPAPEAIRLAPLVAVVPGGERPGGFVAGLGGSF